MADLLKGVLLKKKDGSCSEAEEVLKDKVVALYFSAHWCPPCRYFTPVLKSFYNELLSSEKFEVVFVSSDRTEEDQKKYMEECHGDWYCIPHGSPKCKELLDKYSVTGIPELIIIKADGTEISRNPSIDPEDVDEEGEKIQVKSPSEFLSDWIAA